jgi:hypothetical protein
MKTAKTIQPLPPTYNGKLWSVATLKQLSTEEMRRIIRTFGAAQINAALQRTKEK